MSRISIITATYNAEETVAQCIRCVAAQSVGVEHVIVDGNSSDATMQIVQEHSASIAKIVSERDNGLYDAMNKGIELTSGDIVGILNADDFYPSNDVLAQVEKCFDDPRIDACYGDLFYVDGEHTDKVVRKWRSGEFDRGKFYWGWMPPHPTFFVRRELYTKWGGFNLELGSAADYELMLRFLLKHKAEAAYIPQVLVHMRTGGVSNASIANRLRANRMDRFAWQTNALRPYPWTLMAKPLRKIRQWF